MNSDNNLPDPIDCEFLELFADYCATHHVIVAEGEGALVVEQFFDENRLLPGKCTLIYANTSDVARCHVPRLLKIGLSDLRVFDTTLKAIAQCRHILSNLSLSTRVYGAGGRSFLVLVQQLANYGNDDPRALMLQRREIYWRRVLCSECGAVSEFTSLDNTNCKICSEDLIVTKFYFAGPAISLGVKRSVREQWSMAIA